MTYRGEIDGMRAVAVMAVVLYHAGFSALSGGFAGVDVFFVISGYLITDLIVREVRETGGFRFARFYLRRVRRLVPALLATVVGTAAAAFVLFSPARFADFAASVPMALASVSNVWFWHELDYFSAAAETKPLLHTWSLSVEEQFYLVWPLLTAFVLARCKAWKALAAVGALCLLSLGVAQALLALDANAAFYLLPARIVELGMGAALVWIVPAWERRPRALLDELGVVAGLALIAYAVLAYDKSTPFPGLASLVPCLGAALVVLCGRARFAGACLRLAPLRWTGRISYSLYLVHWPVTVFAIAVSPGDLTAPQKWVVVALSFALAQALHTLVEKRFRTPRRLAGGGVAGSRLFHAGLVATIVAVVAPSVHAMQDGWSWRVPAERRIADNATVLREVRRDYCSAPAPLGTLAGDNPDLFTCQNHRGKKRDLYVWGDSHAQHLAAGFARHYPAYNVHIAYMTGCVPQSGFAGYVRSYRSSRTRACTERNARVLELLRADRGTRGAHVVLTSAKRGRPAAVAAATREILGELAGTRHEVAVLADFIRPGRSLVDCMAVPRWAASDDALARRCRGVEAAAQREIAYNDALARHLPELVRVADVQCPETKCRFFHRGRLLYRDSHHLNPRGSEHFVLKVRERLPFMTNAKRRALASR